MRQRNAERYGTLFESAGLTDRIRLPTAPADRRHIFNQYVIRVREPRSRAAVPRRARHWHRDLLSSSVPSAGVLRVGSDIDAEIFPTRKRPPTPFSRCPFMRS